MIDLSSEVTQQAFGSLVGISQQAVSDLHKRGVLRQSGTAAEWLHDYFHNLREVAAARMSADGTADLVAERARLARAQSIRVEMQNAIAARELAPVAVLSTVIGRVGQQIAAILSAIPVQLKRRSSISMADLEFITTEIVRARNLAAAIELDLDDLAALPDFTAALPTPAAPDDDIQDRPA